jgi:hypothetical protein
MKRKKTKKYAQGGLAGIAESATSLMDDVDNAANVINYGQGAGAMSSPLTSSNDTVGLGAITEATTANQSARPQTPPAQKARSRSSLFGLAKGGLVKSKAIKASSASKRADGCAVRGKTKGRMV